MDQQPDFGDSNANDSLNNDAQNNRALITAYALGELNETDRATIEARLRESAEDRELAEELSRLGKLMRKVAAEPSLAERSSQLRGVVFTELDHLQLDLPLRLRERFPRRAVWLRLSLAASLLVVGGALVALTKMKHAERQEARRDAATVASNTTDEIVDLSEMLEELPSEPEITQFGALMPEPVAREQVDSLELPALQLRQEKESGERRNAPRFAQGGTPGQVPGRFAIYPGYSQNGGLPAGGARGREAQLGTGQGGAGGGGQQTAVPYFFDAGANRPERVERVGGQAKGAGEYDAQADLAAAKDRYAAATADVEGGATNRRSHSRQGEADTFLTFSLDNGGIAANTESYAPLLENPFRKPTEYPLSTFSIDIDTASYTNVRRFLHARALPPPDAVRVEELINYFQYGYPQPDGDVPFSITTDVADCPWNAEHRLLRVGLKGRDLPADERPAGNLVFLLDVSGSMEAANKLPLVKEAMYLLTDKLTERDSVSIIVYAGESGMVLPPTNGTNKAAIRNAIAQLTANGSTNGGAGLELAYETALSQFIKSGTNRVILATDGDFNVGTVDQDALVRLIEEKAKSGVYLSALGFGVGNLKDGTLEKLADKGNGNYAYIDTLGEARRVLVEQLSGTLVTIAKDVKLQIEFNPAQAAEYRLIGYENRLLPPQDFHDDRQDAGDIGAGHTVTALYEIVPAGGRAANGEQPLKYQPSRRQPAGAAVAELATIQLRYKNPEAAESRLIEHVVSDGRPRDAAADGDFQFAAAVAQFGMLLRQSPHRGAASYKSVLALAEQGLGNDPHGYRSEFIELVRQARDLSGGD